MHACCVHFLNIVEYKSSGGAQHSKMAIDG